MTSVASSEVVKLLFQLACLLDWGPAGFEGTLCPSLLLLFAGLGPAASVDGTLWASALDLGPAASVKGTLWASALDLGPLLDLDPLPSWSWALL